MFPNFRLMIVAMFASILGICSGLGLFAAFRVSHEPFARLAIGSRSLQLSLNHAALNQVALNDVGTASFGVRFEVPAPPSGDGDAGASAPAAPVVQASAPNPLPASLQDGAAAALPVAQSDAGDADAKVAKQPVTQDDAARPPSEMVDIAAATPATAPAPVPAPAPQSGNPPAIQVESGPQTAPDRSTKSDGKPIARTVTARTVRSAEKRRRVVKLRHVRGPAVAAAPATTQNITWSQPQSAPQAPTQTTAAVRHRVVSKRRRPTNAAAPQAPTRPQTVAGAPSETPVTH